MTCRQARWIELIPSGQNRPQDARVFVGHGDQRLVVANPLLELPDPAGEPVVSSRRGDDGGTSALNQQGSQIVITLPRDAAEPRLPSAACLFGNKPEPCGKLATVLGLSRIANGR